jgi:hypothetical protein
VELLRLGETQAVKAATGYAVDEHGVPRSGRAGVVIPPD